MPTFSTSILSCCARGFGAMGAVALVSPTRVTDQFGVDTLTADGRNEVRAVYGGFGVAMALALGVAVSVESLRVGIGLTASAAVFGMAAGRLVSVAVDRSFGRFPRLYFVIESIAALALALASIR